MTSSRVRQRPVARWARASRVAALLLAAWSPCVVAAAAGAPAGTTSAILAVTVNGEPKGEFFFYVTADGDYLVKLADFQAITQPSLTGQETEIDGERYVSLRSVKGFTERLNERSLTLEITAEASLLGRKTLDLLPTRRTNVMRPRDASGFFNYRLGYAGAGGSAPTYSLAAGLGARAGDWLLLSDSTHESSGGHGRSVRLQTNLTWDRRPQLQRLVLGDFFTSSGDLGSTFNLGGISFSKRYSIDPYFIKQPMASFTGAVGAPTEADIYLDGMRVRTEKLPPGQFQIENLNYYGGSRNVEVVLKDRFGNEQRIAYSYYFTDTVLRQGLHEYSYDLGAIRNRFGQASNDYGAPALSAFHRYGVTDAFTLGWRGEAAQRRVNLGPELIGRLGTLGTASLRYATSHDSAAGRGKAMQLAYNYQRRAFNARLLARRFSEAYAFAAPVSASGRPRVDTDVGFGYGTPATGNFGFDLASTRRFGAVDRRTATVSYSKSLKGNISIFATLSRVREGTSRNEMFVGLSWYPAKGMNAGFSVQDRDGIRTDTAQVSQSAPIGEGWGYRLAHEQQHGPLGSFSSVSPFVQYNGRYGIYTADYRTEGGGVSGSTSAYQLTAAGAIGIAGGVFGFSRPIDDSFGIVKLGNVAGVRVYQNNQAIGRTGSDGTLFIPNLGSYVDNQIAIEDRDVPFEYALDEKERFVSPPLRSGSLIRFPVKRIQAFTGRALLRTAGTPKPAEYYEGKLLAPDATLAFVTGKGGTFYLENVAPGRHRVILSSGEERCEFQLVIPESTETVVNLGDLSCEDAR